MHSAKLSSQCGMSIDRNVFMSDLSNKLNWGLVAAVGYSVVVIGLTLHFKPERSIVFLASDIQFAMGHAQIK